MYIKNDTIGVIFRVLFLIVCGAGLVMKLFASGFSLSVILGDFALLANALALVYFAYLIIARPSYERRSDSHRIRRQVKSIYTLQ